MAPHADRASSDVEADSAPRNGIKSQIADSEPSRLESTLPLRGQLSELYEDNIAAKIIKTAVNGLVNNVGTNQIDMSFHILTSIRIPQQPTLSMFSRVAQKQANTTFGKPPSGHAASSQAASTL
jgi:hypothetical protein